MSKSTSASRSRLFATSILSAAIFFVWGPLLPLFGQTSETNDTKTHAGSYSVDQVPGDVSPCSECKKQLKKDEDLINLLKEQNSRLKAENAKLKAGK